MHGLTGTPYPRSSATALLTFGLRLTRTSSVAEPRCMAASATARPTDPIPTMPAFMHNLLRRVGKPDLDLPATERLGRNGSSRQGSVLLLRALSHAPTDPKL